MTEGGPGKKFHLSIPGLPMGWQRVTPISGGKPYVPKQTRTREKLIADAFRRKYPDHKPITGPVMLRFTAVFPLPLTTLSKAARAAALEGRLYFTGKPDKDNIEKLIWDALNKVAWADDAQVQGGGTKRYGVPMRTDITIEVLEGLPETPSDRNRRRKAEQTGFKF